MPGKGKIVLKPLANRINHHHKNNFIQRFFHNIPF